MEELRRKIYDFIAQDLNKGNSRMEQAARYTVLNKGHLWRPLVLIKTGESFSVPDETSIPVAAAIEYVHNATLILDDMPSMDNSDIRRGQESCHKKFGGGVAQLTIEYLTEFLAKQCLVHSSATLLQFRAIISEMSTVAGQLLLGQEIDLYDTHTLSLDDMLEFYKMKSGTLYSAAAAIGGILGYATEEELRALRKFGLNLGLAYQLGDDLYDVQDRPTLQKPTGQDKWKKTPIDITDINGTKLLRETFEHKALVELERIKRDMSPLEEMIPLITGTHIESI